MLTCVKHIFHDTRLCNKGHPKREKQSCRIIINQTWYNIIEEVGTALKCLWDMTHNSHYLVEEMVVETEKYSLFIGV